jgi:hypothetical protein
LLLFVFHALVLLAWRFGEISDFLSDVPKSSSSVIK